MHPTDEQIARWLREFGSTGVKNAELTACPDNEGVVVWYRELSLSERTLITRLEEIEEAAPGAYDYPRMVVSLCLLYPTLASLPNEPMGVAELFRLVRQRGHAPLEEDEALTGGGLPAHIATDLARARAHARRALHDPAALSAMTSLALRLATTPSGRLDVVALDYVWRLPAARLRDLAALVEVGHRAILEASLAQLGAALPPSATARERQAALEDLRRELFNPFDTLDGGGGGGGGAAEGGAFGSDAPAPTPDVTPGADIEI